MPRQITTDAHEGINEVPTVLGGECQQHLHLVKLALLRVGGGRGEGHQCQRRTLLGDLRARGGGGHGGGARALRHGFGSLCQSC